MRDEDRIALEREALRFEGKPFHRGGVKFRRALLPFTRRDARLFFAECQRPFLPRGLLIWDAPASAEIEMALVGADLQLVASLGNVPARFFATGDSYEQIAKQLDQGAEPPAWCDWDPVEPGVAVRITFNDGAAIAAAPIQLVMWGIAVV